MGLIYWLALAVLGILGVVFIGFAQSAIADLVVSLAVRMYSADPLVRTERLEEWRSEIEAMKPTERPSHAGSLLWLGTRRLPTTVHGLRAQRKPQTTDRETSVSRTKVAGWRGVRGGPIRTVHLTEGKSLAETRIENLMAMGGKSPLDEDNLDLGPPSRLVSTDRHSEGLDC